MQHRKVAEAMHAIGEALERPDAPLLPREAIRLFAGGRRMDVGIRNSMRFAREVTPRMLGWSGTFGRLADRTPLLIGPECSSRAPAWMSGPRIDMRPVCLTGAILRVCAP